MTYCKDCCNFSSWLGCFASGKPIRVVDPVTGVASLYVPGARDLAQCQDRKQVPAILNVKHDCSWFKPRPLPALFLFLRRLFRR